MILSDLNQYEKKPPEILFFPLFLSDSKEKVYILPVLLISNKNCGITPQIVQTFNELIMERSEIQKRVKEVVGRVLETDSSEIADGANFIFDLGADSMQSLELVAGFEEEFDVELDEDKALEVQNLDDAVEFIAESL